MTAKMRSVVFCRWVAIALAALLFDAGYARAQSSPPPANTAAAAIADEDEWSVCTIKGVRVGYQETTIHHATKDGRQVVVERQITHAAVKRFGQTTTMDMELSSTETPAGRLLDFQSEVRQGPAPLRTSGQVRGDRLEIQTTTSGKTISSSIPWPADEGGFFAVEQSLLRRPMKAGEQRTIHCLMGLANQVVQVDLTAEQGAGQTAGRQVRSAADRQRDAAARRRDHDGHAVDGRGGRGAERPGAHGFGGLPGPEGSRPVRDGPADLRPQQG